MAEHHFTLQRKMPGIVPVEIWFMNRGRIQKNSTNQKFIMLLGGMLMYALPALNPPFFPWDLWDLISTISSTMIWFLNPWTAGEKIFWEAWSSESAAGCCSWRQLPRQHAVDRASLRRALWRSAARHALCAAAAGVPGGCLRSNRARDQWWPMGTVSRFQRWQLCLKKTSKTWWKYYSEKSRFDNAFRDNLIPWGS